MEKLSKKISVIPPKVIYQKKEKSVKEKIRVAAYCRVSSEKEEQEKSYETQIEYYKEKIAGNTEWILAGIFADDGKSGTNTKKRDDFNALIRKCMQGKIDLVITKSVSRFARNTVDSLVTIRKLKAKGIAIFFEKENVNTMDSTGELLITILSSLAQEESRNISENVTWGIVRKFEKGKVIVNEKKFMGYTKDEDGNLIIVPEEAEVVKKIFKYYLEGMSFFRISCQLEAQGIKTVTGNSKWEPGVIDRMLKNEKYMGDALLQKTYTVDYLTKKRVKNRGEKKQFYIEDNHEAIISKDLFYKVQAERARRANRYHPSDTGQIKGRYSSKYALTELMICGCCSDVYRRITWYDKNRNKIIVWRCNNRRTNGKKSCPNSPSLNEKMLQEAIVEAINSIVIDKTNYIENFRQNVIKVICRHKEVLEDEGIDHKIEELQAELLRTIEMNTKEGSKSFSYDKQYRQIAEKLKELEYQKERIGLENRCITDQEKRIQEFENYTARMTGKIRNYDDALVRKLISSIKVIAKDKILIQFKSGIIVEQEIRSEI